MKLRWHYPRFVSTDERKTIEVASAAAFYDLPRIKELAGNEGFIRWSISDDSLMWEGTDSFWVIAFLDKNLRAALDLPKWKMPLKDRVELINRQLPGAILYDDHTIGEDIAKARNNKGTLEFQFEDDTAWVPVPEDQGIAWGGRSKYSKALLR